MIFSLQAHIFQRYVLVKLLKVMVRFFFKPFSSIQSAKTNQVTTYMLLIASLP